MENQDVTGVYLETWHNSCMRLHMWMVKDSGNEDKLLIMNHVNTEACSRVTYSKRIYISKNTI